MTAGLRLVLPIVCLLAAGAARATWPSVSTELPATGIGANDAAVIVGVTDYAFLPKIPGAADNATDWFRYLVKTRGVPQERVHMLRNIDATAETILEAVDRAASEVQPGGALWFLFIGHGAPAPDHADGLVLGADTQVSEKSLVARGVPQKAILERLEQGRHAQAIVMFDACFSGTTGDGKLQLVPGSQATVPVRRVEVAAGRSSIFSASDQVAGPLPNHDRPAFSYLMLGAARGWADKDKDATITVGEAFEYAREVLRTMVRGRSQVPSLRGAREGRFAERATEAGPDLVDLQAALAPSGDIFRASSLAVPTIDLGSLQNTTLDTINMVAERALETALDAQEHESATAERKRDAWCTLAGIVDKNPYLAQAQAACAQWRQYIEDEAKLEASMMSDYNVLVGYVDLRRRTKEMKLAAIDSFLSAYGKYGQRQEVLAARKARDNIAADRPAGISADGDEDGLLIDSCPDQAEDKDGDADDDGCPEVSTVQAAGAAAGAAGTAVRDAGLHLYLFEYDNFRANTGTGVNFGLWDQTGVPPKWDQLSLRPTVSWVNRVSWGPLETGVHLNWDLARDIDDGAVSLDAHAGGRLFGVKGWTPSVGVDLRNALELSEGRRGGLGVYVANDLFPVGGLHLRVVYRYGLEPPGAMLPVHSLQLEMLLGAITPEGAPLFELLGDLLDDD